MCRTPLFSVLTSWTSGLAWRVAELCGRGSCIKPSARVKPATNVFVVAVEGSVEAEPLV